MRRSEVTQAFEEFRSLRESVAQIGGRASREDVDQRERLWSLFELLREDIELFGPEEKEEILSLERKDVFPTPYLKQLHRSASRSRSRSVTRRLEVSSLVSASFQSADMSHASADSLASLMEAKLKRKGRWRKREGRWRNWRESSERRRERGNAH